MLAWVTGSTGYLGREIAADLELQGCTVIYHGTKRPSNLPAHKPFVQGDCSQETEVKRMIAEIESNWGLPDFLVCCAGGVYFGKERVKQGLDCFLSKSNLQEMIDRNLMSAVLCAQPIATKMIKRNSGKIIFIGSSIVGNPRPKGAFCGYSLAKAALHEYTTWLANQLLETNVKVNCVAPGTIPKIPAPNAGKPSNLAKLVSFMCLQGDHINGQTIRLNGGGL